MRSPTKTLLPRPALVIGLLFASTGCGSETDITRLTAITQGPAEDRKGDGAPHATTLNPARDGTGGGSEVDVERGAIDAQVRSEPFLGLPHEVARRLDAPPLLSETGAFTSVGVLDESTLGEATALRAASFLVPYDVQTPLWSDGAHKRRWIAVPEGGQIGFAANGPWVFPTGTVLVKQFEMALDERAPEERRLLETRFLVAAADGGYYGVTYKWNAAGTDAELLHGSQTEELEIVGADGAVRRQRYDYPGPADCLTCHNAKAGYVLGFRTAQLNGDHLDVTSGREGNQLTHLQALGFLDSALDPDWSVYPRLAALDDASSSLYDRVRSYWDSNCSMCHGVRADIRARWDARFETPLAARGLIAEPSFSGAEGAYLIVPSDADSSVLYQRVSTTARFFKMPPVGRNRNDERFIELLRAWIDSLSGPSVDNPSP